MGREERKKRRAGERGGEVRLPHSKFLDPPLTRRSRKQPNFCIYCVRSAVVFVYVFGVIYALVRGNLSVVYSQVGWLSHCRTRAIGVARGCSGCTCTPQGGEKNFQA